MLTEARTIQSTLPVASAVLRRLDWRFLLPLPRDGQFDHLILLGGDADLAERIVQIGMARRVSRQIDPGAAGTADALILLHDAQTPLAAAIPALRAQGVLYFEAERRLSDFVLCRPAAVQRRLAQLGLSMTGVYSILPDFTRPQIYLPFDLPQALRWYMESIFVASTPARRLLASLMRGLGWWQRDALLCPTRGYAVTAVKGSMPTAAPSMLGDPRFPSELRPPDVRPLLLTAGDDDWSRIILLPFSSRSTRPVGVLKFSRLPERNRHTENEQRMLAHFHSSLDGDLARSIPQPLGLIHWQSLAVSIESCVPGRLFAATTGQWGTPLRQKLDVLPVAAGWLTDFHRQTAVERIVWREDSHARWVEDALTAYAAVFALTADEEALFASVRRRSHALMGASLPMVWEHYGFDDQNLYGHGGDVYVVDWEGAAAGLPLFDLLYFVVRWNDRLHGWNRAARRRGFARLFCESGSADPMRAMVDRIMATYLQGLGIDARFYPLLMVLMWVKRALSRAERQITLGTHGAELRSGNVYVEYVAQLAACTGLLIEEQGGTQ